MVRPGLGSVDAARSLPTLGWAGVGTTTLRELSDHPVCQRPTLLDHHLLLLVTVGRGSHDIDFHTHQCRPGTLIWAHPGQVIRYGGQAGLDAIVLCWDPAVFDGLGTHVPPVSPVGPACWQLAGEDEDAVINEVSQLVVDCQRHRAGADAARLLRHQLAVLLLRLALLPAGDRAAGRTENATFQRLRQEVERWYAHSHRVEDYAATLGCSVRTLTRACLAATGRSAKRVIGDRVILQAMRLLAATEAPIADIGRRLGFSEPTNFGRFFQREVGRSPGAFRHASRHPVPRQRQAAPVAGRAPLSHEESCSV
jgi:AraC-like DNA-binding protein